MDQQADVVIIGAGISGLSSACLLRKEGLNIVVLEARDRVGGRTYTVRDAVHGAVDVGGAYIGPTQDRVLRLIKELGLQVYNIDESRNTVLQLCGHWTKFKGNIPPMRNPLAYLNLHKAIRTIDRMAQQISLDAPWKANKAEVWDKMTVQELLSSLCWTREAREILKIFVNTVYAAEPHEISLLFFLTYIQSGGGTERLSSITHGAQEKKIVGGSQQISEKMAESLGQLVRLSCPVVSVCQDSSGAVVTTSTGQTFKCRYVICAVPLPLLSRIQFSPPLPTHKTQLLQRTPMGSIIKTVTFYETAFWRELDLNGIAMSDRGPSVYCMDDTKPDGSNPAIMAFLLADFSRDIADLSTEERKSKVCEHLAETFRCKKFLQPTGYVEKNWMEEEYSGGCYTCVLPPGVLTQYGRVMRSPFQHVFFAGSETARRWMGYMDGAVEAGERAAREILFALGKIDRSGIWREEPESADFPATQISVSFVEQILPSVPVFLSCIAAVVCVLIGICISWISE